MMTKEELHDLILESGFSSITPTIKKQLISLITEGYTYEQVGMAVWYLYTYKGIEASDMFGIGLVRNSMLEAITYCNEKRDKQELQAKQARQYLEDQALEKKVIKVKPRPSRKKYKKIDLDKLKK